MPTLSVTEQINAPLDHVFDLFTDLEHAAEHISGIDRVEILTDGPIGVGTRWRETRTMWGKAATEEMEITEFSLNDRYTAVAESFGARYLSRFRFTRNGATTDVTMEFEVIPISLAAKLLTPLAGLMNRSVLNCIKQDLLDLKQVAESDSGTDRT